ncbi:MAG: hypothetical protein ACREPT_15340 [Rudaea sp.]
MRALVDATGQVQDAALVGGSASQSKQQPVDEQAPAAVENHRFAPIVRSGEATAAWVPVPVDFHGANGPVIDISG